MTWFNKLQLFILALLFPACAANSNENNSTVRLTLQDDSSGEFSRDEFFKKAQHFIGDFDYVCVDTSSEPDKISAAADDLGWMRVNEAALEGKNRANWVSIDIMAPEQSNGHLFILDVQEKRMEHAAHVACMLTMWGRTVDKNDAKEETEIFRQILSQKYDLGEITERGSDDATTPGELFYQYGFLINDSDAIQLTQSYLWMGGAHNLVAVRKTAAKGNE